MHTGKQVSHSLDREQTWHFDVLQDSYSRMRIEVDGRAGRVRQAAMHHVERMDECGRGMGATGAIHLVNAKQLAE
jgi:hypothetical protein